LDRIFWTTLRYYWSRWTEVLVILKPNTVNQLSPRRLPSLLANCDPGHDGRPKVSGEIRALIQQLAHGFVVTERSVARSHSFVAVTLRGAADFLT
jgi:hypothetical protein